MAQKRMFNNLVIGSDDFLEMPDSSQNLYFHLSMQADDDGFISNWKSIMRMTGKKEDDLKILIAKSFIVPFETGVLVIRHWRLNNYIQKDRYKSTVHIAEKNQLVIDNNNVYNLDTSCTPRIDKNRIDKININIYGQDDLDQTGSKKEIWEEQFEEFYKKYPKKVKKQDVKKWFKKNKPSSELFSSMMSSLEQFRGSKDWLKEKGQYIPYPSTWLNQKRWEDEAVNENQTVNSSKTEYKEINAEEMTEEQYIAMVRGGKDV